MQKHIKKALIVLVSTWFAGYMWGQSPNQQVHNCSIVPSPKSNQPESAFCNDCDYWTNGVVPFEFHSNVTSTQRQQMLDAMSRLEGIANIDFIPRNGQDNYIRVVAGNGNSSSVGMQGGRQDVTVVSWNWPMIICHELLHALGFWHEQSRPDRNNYVMVNAANICPGQEHNFNIEDTGVTANIPYDFSSIMHYERFAFSICSGTGLDCNTGCNGGFFAGPTLEVLPQHQNAQNQIGNRDYISRTDSLMLRFTYPFPSDRFVNVQFSPQQQSSNGLAIYSAMTVWAPSPLIMNIIPAGGDVWMMPGTYIYSEGTYTKPMTLRAPFSGVVLK